MIMNRVAVIEQLKQARNILDNLLALLEAREGRQVRSASLPVPPTYRRTCERANKGNKAIERSILSSYQIAQSLGFKGDFRAWEPLLRIHD